MAFNISLIVNRLFYLLAKPKLTGWIFISLALGILIGFTGQKDIVVQLQPLGTVFIRMLQAVISPLVFVVLIHGISAHSKDVKQLGGLAAKTLIWFIFASGISLVIGAVCANLIQPGVGITIPQNADTSALGDAGTGKTQITWYGELYTIVPKSFFAAMVDGTVIAVVFCALMMAVAILTMEDRQSADVLIKFFEAMQKALFRVIALVMNYAPIGIGASIAVVCASQGSATLIALGKLIGSLHLGVALFLLIVTLPTLLILRTNWKEFFAHIYKPLIVAMTTTSTEAAFPITLEEVTKYGVPTRVAALVLPLGYNFNLDGAAIHMANSALFCLQAAQVQMTISDQVVLLLYLMLLHKGVASVPRATLVVLASAAGKFGFPVQAITLILGVDAILDIARTGVNLIGSFIACIVVAKWDGSFRGEEWAMDMAAKNAAVSNVSVHSVHPAERDQADVALVTKQDV
ncbi:glutamate-aspartate carrier protein [Cladochytrium replicatum]|nr:glutamate-aspartate carrier protein [Cladochytrium replicatum]